MKSANQTLLWWGLAGVGLLVVATCFLPAGIPPLEAMVWLAIGWVPFIFRSAPQATIDWPSAVIGVVALGLFVGGLHAFLKSFRRVDSDRTLYIDDSGAASDSAPPHRFSRSLSIAGVVLAMFTAGICAIGMTHQAVWMFTSDEPWLSRHPEERMRVVSRDQLKGVNRGLDDYSLVNSQLPAGGTRDDRGRMLHGWYTQILPYIEQRPLYDQIDLAQPWDSQRNREWMKKPLPMLWIHNHSGPPLAIEDESGFGVSHYTGNVLVLGGDATRRATDLTDGAANTLLCGEAAYGPKAWGSPTHWRDPRLGLGPSAETFGGPWRRTPGATFVMADGSTRFIDAGIDPRVLAALATPDGGE